MFDSLQALTARLAATGYFIDPVMIQVIFLAEASRSPFSSRDPLARAKR